MKRNKPEAEVVARIDCETQQAYICVCEWPKFAKKFERIYGKPTATYDRDGGVVSAWWVVPMKCVSFRTPGGKKKGRAISKAQVAAMQKGRRKRRVHSD